MIDSYNNTFIHCCLLEVENKDPRFENQASENVLLRFAVVIRH